MKKLWYSASSQLFFFGVSWVSQRARFVALAFLLIAVLSGIYSAKNLSINTDTENMLSPELPFRQHSIMVSEEFPHLSDNIIIVIDSPTADQTHYAANLLGKKLRDKPELFGITYDPESDPFFEQNGLLFLSVEELEELSLQLIEAQPFLGRLGASADLVTLFKLIQQLLDNSGTADDTTFSPLAENAVISIAEVIENKNRNVLQPLSWQKLLSPQKSKDNGLRRIIITQPKTDFSSLQPGAEAIISIRQISKQLMLKEKYNSRVRLTGSLALSNEELESVVDGLGYAGLISIILVGTLLLTVLRSFSLLLSSLVTLFSGLLITLGFATIAIGTLNLISVAFAVLFIGLSVDFSIHFCLRYKEKSTTTADHPSSLAYASQSSGPPLTLVAVTAAIGFYSFLPTDYLGLAELGLISGTGMFIALITNFTLLPALITILPKFRIKNENRFSIEYYWLNYVHQFKKSILAITILITILSATMISGVTFSFDPIKLRDPSSESVQTLLDISTDSEQSPYSITILCKDLITANQLAAKLESMSTVRKTITLSNLIPHFQDEKIEIIENLSVMLLPSITSHGSETPPPISLVKQTILNLTRILDKNMNSSNAKSLSHSSVRLKAALEALIKQSNFDSESIEDLNRLLLGGFSARLNSIRKALEAEKITLKNIPNSVKRQFLGKSGQVKLEVYPVGNMQAVKQLERFVRDVQSLSPGATGAPVIILEARNVVIKSFMEAATLTFLLILILLIVITRSHREIILIIAPLIIASLLTGAASILLSLPLNFANIIVIPLLFGLGIAGNIHMVARARNKSVSDMIATSTPTAIIFSSLTTVGSFGSIALSSHPGTSSMGFLLAVAIGTTLFCTLFILPNLMNFWTVRHDHK